MTVPFCKCVSPADSATCNFPRTCGKGRSLQGSEYANSDVSPDEKKRAIQAVGALVIPDTAGASAILIADSLVLTAGHLFLDPVGASAPNRDAQSAHARVLVMNMESESDCQQRRTFVLSTLMATNRYFKRRRDDSLDYALCRVEPDVAGRSVSGAFRSVSLSGKLPKKGDKLNIIHHAYNVRVKQVTPALCTCVFGQTIYLDRKFQSGASGGLIVDSDWRAVGMLVGGGSTYPYGFLIGSILRDAGIADAMVDATGGAPVGRDATVEPIEVARANVIRLPRSGRFGGWAEQIGDGELPKGVEQQFPAVGKLYSGNVELEYAEQGTCFLVARNWILTAHHVASCPEAADRLLVDFKYNHENSPTELYPRPIHQGKLYPAEGYYASCDGFSSCDGARYHLDYALIKYRPSGELTCPGPIRLSSTLPSANTEIFIVQHAVVPGLERKGVLVEKDAVAGSRNLLKDCTEELVFHLAARSGGTSGAPVLTANGEAFAMHTHEATSTHDPSEKLKSQYHWGVRLSAVARDLLARHPNLKSEHSELSTFLELGES